MLSREPDAPLHRTQARESNLQAFRERIRERLRAPRPARACTSGLRRSCVCLLKCVRRLGDLHKRRRRTGIPLVELLERMRALVTGEVSLDHPPETFERQESVDDRRGLITAAHHAVGAFWIAAARTILFPLGGLHELFEGLSVTILQKVAGLLPAEDVVCGRAPRRAVVVAIAHEKLEKQGRHIELPTLFPVR